MGHKGYNGRVITMWLGDCMERASNHSTTNNRDFGQWLHERHQNEGTPWPDDADIRFAPICVAMFLRSYSLKGFLGVILAEVNTPPTVPRYKPKPRSFAEALNLHQPKRSEPKTPRGSRSASGLML